MEHITIRQMKQLSAKTELLALKTELENYLKSKYTLVRKEVLYNKIMDTKREFRADYMVHDFRESGNILIEINGGQFIGGRHTRGGEGYERDLTKINMAQQRGFRVYQFTYQMLKRQEYKNYL